MNGLAQLVLGLGFGFCIGYALACMVGGFVGLGWVGWSGTREQGSSCGVGLIDGSNEWMDGKIW